MVKYSVMVRNLPKELCSDEALQAYFKKMYRDTHDAIVVRDIGSLASTTQEYIDVTVGLETARVTWEKAQMDPKLRKAGKVPQRPTMRRLPALTKVKCGNRAIIKWGPLTTPIPGDPRSNGNAVRR